MNKISLVRDERGLFAVYLNEKGVRKSVDVSVFLRLGKKCDELLNCLFTYMERGSSRSGLNLLRAAVWLGNSLRRLEVNRVPRVEKDWQQLVIEIQRDLLTTTESRATLKTRATILIPLVEALLSHLQREGWIPEGVALPKTSKNFSTMQNRTANAVLGEKAPKRSLNYDSKLLCSVSLSRTDAAYLEEIQSELATRRAALRDVLMSYWSSLRAHFNYGRELMATVDRAELLARVDEHERICTKRSKHDLKSAAFCTPDTEAKLAEYLVIIDHFFGGVPTDKQRRTAKCVPTMLSASFELPIPPELGVLAKGDGRRLQVLNGYIPKLRWMLGRLIPRDISVLAALLIMEEPRFTPEAVTFARLYDEKGQKLVEIGDGGERFSVAKHRAKSLKTARLSELSSEIVRFASETSQEIRKELKKAGSPLGDLLFIPCNNNGTAAIGATHERILLFLSGAAGGREVPWMGDLFPQLESAGLSRGTVNFARIRNTEGVLEWFRTGSERAMARKLGNAAKTTIDHYIPPVLMRAWNTRLIRRFQNLWICVSVANEDWLLEVTDFSTLEELHGFLSDMLSQHDALTSPLGEQLHARFAKNLYAADISDQDRKRNWLAVSISKNSLCALYLYLDASLSIALPESIKNHEDGVTHTTPRQFIDLALLLRHRLPVESSSELRQIHIDAEEMVRKLQKTVKWQSIFFKSVV
ncbi:hypothetical protein [Burkholderia orbicola]|uniref:hypothetical protein n=1 Tax=Burkholderia orbicola TaxID=2978683 RepID=UPI002FE35F1D